MAAWTPSALGSTDRVSAGGGGLPKAFGVIAVLVLAGFLASAWGIWQQTAWWPMALVASAVVAIPTAMSVWNPVGNVTAMAVMANIGLIGATLMPWGDRFLGSH